MIDARMVAVYGTLKRGMINHRLLAGARFVGIDRLTSITLYDLGEYPAALLESSDGVSVELYEVDTAHLAELDKLEEYDASNPEAGLYRRCICQTSQGAAWIYIYNHAIEGKLRVGGGDWAHS